MTRESEIEDYFKLRVKQAGGICLKLKFINRNGAPDRLALLPSRHFLAELKRPKKKAEAHQLRLHILLRKAGFEVFLLDTKEKIDEVFK